MDFPEIVDIDKVLDAFEESEALQEDVNFKTLTTPLESSAYLNLHNCEKLSKCQLSPNKPLGSCNMNITSVSNFTSKANNLAEPSENSIKKCNIFEADFSPTEKMQNVQSFQTPHTWNYEIYYKSFQPLTEFSEETKSGISDFNFQSTSSVANSIKEVVQSYEKSDLINCGDQFNPDEVLCVSVERADAIAKNTPVVSLKTVITPCRTENFRDVKVTVNNNDVAIETFKKSSNNASEHETSPNEYMSLPQSSTHVPKEIISALPSFHINETSSTTADNFVLAENEDISNNGSSHLKENDICLSKKSLCFSEIEEPVLSLDDMNEYLENIAPPDPILDEDSGVSSQEDVNGNNLSLDLDNKENDFTQLASSSNSKDNLGKITSVDKELQNSFNDISLQRTAEEQNGNSSVCKNGVIVLNDEHIKFNFDIKQHLIVESNSIAKHNIVTSTGAIPKQDTKQSFRSNLENLSFSSISENCSNTVTDCFSGQSDLIKKQFNESNETADNFMLPASENSNSLNNSLPRYKQNDVIIESNLGNNVHLHENESLHLSISTEDNVHNIKPSDSFEPVNNMNSQKQSSEIVHECDSSVLIENLTHSPKLQRPTTLNLPFRNVNAPVINHSLCSDVAESSPICDSSDVASSLICHTSDVAPPPICDSSGAPSEEALVEMLVEDSNIFEGSTEALPEPQSIIHVPQVGAIKPFWIPDSDAANCMHCNIKFTVIKRRHHCRACGKVLCSSCCNQKARLIYLPSKENRVCQQCFDILSASQIVRSAIQPGESPASSSCGSSPSFPPAQVNSNFIQKGYWRPHPNNPDDYCSTISPLQQVQHLVNRPPPTVMVPVGVLKRGTKPRGEPKQVIFSDGIRPGGDLTDLTEPVELIPAYRQPRRRRVDKGAIDNHPTDSSLISMSLPAVQKFANAKNRQKRIVVSDLEGPLPPILVSHDQVSNLKFDLKLLIEKLKDDQLEPVIFAITKNLHVLTKITKLDCYFGKECWCFTSHGLCTVAQDEVLFILERFPDEDIIPRDAFQLFSKLYDNACKGSTVNELGHIVFSDNIFGNGEHKGFLFVRPTFQILNKLVLPNTPFLVAILIQKWEVPWAKVFPLRLMLRLGEEYRHYPCSLVSVRFRKPVYYKIGETIMSVLADLRNYQFTVPFVPGLVVHIEDKKMCVNIPRNRYEKLMKVLSSNNVEHVLALGANFSTEADSHLVCMQAESGDYVTQAMRIKDTTRKVTGASFIVFSGALKSSTGFSAKFSIVEDGLLIQIPQETMDSLHSALREMHDLTINCGPINSPDPEVVIIQWTKDDRKFNLGVRSPVDGKLMEGVPSLRIHASTDYAGESYLIRWTEVFFLEVDENANNKRIDAIDPCRLAETVAQACCMALVPFLNPLFDAEMTKIGLRVTLDTKRDKVEYDVGAHGQPLPSMYMNTLDSNLIPVISRITGATQDEPIALELIFHVLIK